MDLEGTIRDIIATKGYRMSDVASRMGVTQSNLVASLRKNPKLSTIIDLSNAIGCSITDILQPTSNSNRALGIAIVDGVTYRLTKADPSTVQIPVYTDHQELRREIRRFVSQHIEESGDGVNMGIVDYLELYTLLYNPSCRMFHLALYYSQEQTIVRNYDLLKYGKPTDVESLLSQIIADIESAATVILEERKSRAFEQYVKAVNSSISDSADLPQDSEQ